MTRNPARPIGLATVVAVALAASILASIPTAAAAATPPLTALDANLLRNPGAEAGVGTNGYQSVAIPGWTKTSAFTVVRYGAPGFPTNAEASRVHGGKFFACGSAVPSAYASQSIGLRGRQTIIDFGHVRVTLSALLASYGSQSDYASLILFFRDGAGNLIGSSTGPAVSATDSLFIHKSTSAVAPAGTRTIQVRLAGARGDGNGDQSYCDAYFDNVSLVLHLV